MNKADIEDVIIIGAGPAALSAAIYTCREDLRTVLLERGIVGGLAATTDWVDNYPGYSDGLAGTKLAHALRAQAERFGATIKFTGATNIARMGNIVRIDTPDGPLQARAVLLATGTNHKKLGVPGEAEFHSRGVHYCATCDGAFYKDRPIIVIGGGNSAVQEAIFLTRFATRIDLLVRTELRASEVLQHELQKYPQITVHTNITIEAITHSDTAVTGVRVTDKKDGLPKDIPADGVFIFIGLLPNTGFLRGTAVKLEDSGFIKSDKNLQTNVPGIFVAGDVRSDATMQIASAVGEGATAALKIREYLEGGTK